jgi:lipid-A-disaccharide synthase
MAKVALSRPNGHGLALVAGEVSGDLLASRVLSALNALPPETESEPVKTFGIGGPRMQEQGFSAWWPSETLSVRGYVEVLSAYPKLRSIRNQLRDRLLAEPPKLYVGVDAPDFNLHLEAQLRARKIRTAHFISPSIWAWRGGRINQIRDAVDHMLVVFPFEEQIYRKAKIPATFVGHPLADDIPLVIQREPALKRLGIARGKKMIAMLPGSRLSEINHNAPRFLKTMQVIAKLRDDWSFVWPAATPAIRARLDQIMIQAQVGEQFPVSIIDGQSHDTLAACDGVLVASGTATLEAALFKRPMVISYHMNPISYQIMKPMAYLPYVGLPNILGNEFIVPEFIQGAAKPQIMATALVKQVESDSELTRLEKRFTRMHQDLRQNCAHRTAQVLFELMY